jgi:Ribulose-phosphate 3 epimerase family
VTPAGATQGGRAGAGPRLSAGVITADLARLGAEMDVLRGRAHWAHVDVMDGVFCPQLTVGPFDGKDAAGNLAAMLAALGPPAPAQTGPILAASSGGSA